MNTGARRIYRIYKRDSLFRRRKGGKYGRGYGKNEEEMKDQLALLRKLAKGVVWCSVYTRVCLRRMFVGSCAYMHSAFWSSSLFFISLSSLFQQHFFSFSFRMAESGGNPDGHCTWDVAIVGVVCLRVCSIVVCVCLCGGMECVYLN